MLQTLNRAPTALDASGFGEARPRDDGDDEDYDDGAFARATTGLKRTATDEKPEEGDPAAVRKPADDED